MSPRVGPRRRTGRGAALVVPANLVATSPVREPAPVPDPPRFFEYRQRVLAPDPDSLRLLSLEQRPDPDPLRLLSLQQRPAADPLRLLSLEQRPDPDPLRLLSLQQRPAPDPLRLLSLEQRPDPDPLRLLSLQQRPAPDPLRLLSLQQRPDPDPLRLLSLQQRPDPDPLRLLSLQQRPAPDPLRLLSLQQRPDPDPLRLLSLQQRLDYSYDLGGPDLVNRPSWRPLLPERPARFQCPLPRPPGFLVAEVVGDGSEASSMAKDSSLREDLITKDPVADTGLHEDRLDEPGASDASDDGGVGDSAGVVGDLSPSPDLPRRPDGVGGRPGRGTGLTGGSGDGAGKSAPDPAASTGATEPLGRAGPSVAEQRSRDVPPAATPVAAKAAPANPPVQDPPTTVPPEENPKDPAPGGADPATGALSGTPGPHFPTSAPWSPSKYQVVNQGAESIQHALGLRRPTEAVDEDLEKELLEELKFGGFEVGQYEAALREAIQHRGRGVQAHTLYFSFRDCLETMERMGRTAVARHAYEAKDMERRARSLVETELFISTMVTTVHNRVRELLATIDAGYKTTSETVRKHFELIQKDVNLIRSHVHSVDDTFNERVESLNKSYQKREEIELAVITKQAAIVVDAIGNVLSEFHTANTTIKSSLGPISERLNRLVRFSEDIERDLRNSASHLRWRLLFGAGLAGFIGAGFGSIVALLVWAALAG